MDVDSQPMDPMRRFLMLSVFALALALATPLAALGQSRTTSAVRGSVIGPDSTPLVGATVTVRHSETGATRTGVTNQRGAFLVLLLQPGGPYTVTVEHLGFATGQVDDLVLQVGEAYTVEVLMRERAVELAGIDVAVDRATIFNPKQVGPATRLTERTLESTPILSRDVMELAVLSPLVKRTEGGGFSVAGQNDRYNAILVDGLVSKDMFGLTAGGVPGGQAGAKLIPIDAVSQYEVLVAPFDVRLSGFTGGVMNAVTRSGANDWRVRVSGVHRAEALMGDLTLPTGPVEASGVDRSVVAFSVGGPIVRDKGHFFVAGEFERRHQPPAGYNLGREPTSLVRVSEDAMDGLTSTMAQQHGVDVGAPGIYTLGQTLSNVFARSDWSFGGGDRLVIRNVFARASNDEAPNRSAFLPYELSSNAVFRRSTNNITSVQLFSGVGEHAANELDVTVQRSTDRTRPASDWPQVEVDLASAVDGVGFRRPVRVGGQFFAQQNALEQTSVRVTDAIDLPRDDDVTTLGLTASYYDIRHTFLPGALGEYWFPSFSDLERNAPYRYQRAILAEGADPEVDFQVIEWGAFVQHLMTAESGLTMHFGLRVDVPHVLGSPGRNPEVLDEFGLDSSQLPSGNLLFSPRFGFNWQSDGQRLTQVRGGFGWFAGQIPYVWLSNALHNDGLRSRTVMCEGRHYEEPVPSRPAPPLDVMSPPTSCYNPLASVQPAFREVRSVVAFEDGFRYPQDLKFSVAVDRELGDRTSLTLGALFNKALNQIGLRELNIESGGGGLVSLGGTERRYYTRISSRFDQVLLVTNEGEDWGASLSAEVKGMLGARTAFSVGYAIAKAWDRTSLTFTDTHSNFGFNATKGDVNRPLLRTSNFDRPHKLVAAVYGSPFPGLPDTEVSILYTAQSGLPFSYVYGGDVNGDGYPGNGGAFDRTNDLLYVPEDLSEAPLTLLTRVLLADAIENDACIGRYVGRVVPRNGCRAPWEHRLDLRLAHTLRWGDRDIRFEGDLINVLNLLNRDWGKVETTRPVVPLIELCDLGCDSPLPASWGAAMLPTRDGEGGLRSPDPWTVVMPDSQWQMQFGVRVTMGGSR